MQIIDFCTALVLLQWLQKHKNICKDTDNGKRAFVGKCIRQRMLVYLRDFIENCCGWFYKSVSRDLKSLSFFCFYPPLQDNPLRLLTIQFPCHFALSFSETWYTTAQKQSFCYLGLGREPGHIAKWNKQNIDWVLTWFFPIFWKAIENK